MAFVNWWLMSPSRRVTKNHVYVGATVLIRGAWENLTDQNYCVACSINKQKCNFLKPSLIAPFSFHSILSQYPRLLPLFSSLFVRFQISFFCKFLSDLVHFHYQFIMYTLIYWIDCILLILDIIIDFACTLDSIWT